MVGKALGKGLQIRKGNLTFYLPAAQLAGQKGDWGCAYLPGGQGPHSGVRREREAAALVGSGSVPDPDWRDS